MTAMCTCTQYSLVLAFVWRCHPFLSLKQRGREIETDARVTSESKETRDLMLTR
jgi:hypothetical protein